MSTSYSREGKGRYGSFRLRMNVWVCRVKKEIPWEHVPYLSASEVTIHEEALYHVYDVLLRLVTFITAANFGLCILGRDSFGHWWCNRAIACANNLAMNRTALNMAQRFYSIFLFLIFYCSTYVLFL